MLTTAADVLTRAKERIGALAERTGDPSIAATDADDPLLEGYLSDAFTEVAKDTDRLETTTRPSTTPGQGYVEKPAHIETIQEARVLDGGTAYEMRVYDGAETSRAAQSPDATSGRPKFIGGHSGRLWLHPVPEKEYELLLVCQQNGAHQDTAPADDTEPPTLDGLVDELPAELERALVAYVVAEWFADRGEPGVGKQDRRRFERDLRKYSPDPNKQRTHERRYSPLGGIL